MHLVQVDFERQVENDDGSTSTKVVKRSLFAFGNNYPQKKVMTFNKHTADFSFYVNYGDLSHLSKEELRWVQFSFHVSASLLPYFFSISVPIPFYPLSSVNYPGCHPPLPLLSFLFPVCLLVFFLLPSVLVFLFLFFLFYSPLLHFHFTFIIPLLFLFFSFLSIFFPCSKLSIVPNFPDLLFIFWKN